MALKNLDESPRVTDDIVIDLPCPGADGCFTADPYKVESVVIYYVERNFISGNYGQYDRVAYSDSLVQNAKTAQALACATPTDINIAAAQLAESELLSAAQVSTFNFSEAVAVLTVGDAQNPAWLSSDQANADIDHVTADADGNTQYGHFSYTWRPQGSVRAGDFFVCWTWTPNPSGDSLSANICFSLAGDPSAVTAIPTHLTPPNKYQMLLSRYTPQMYSDRLSDNDITPQTLDTLNKAMGDGFTILEDQANQLIDLLDANALHESMLVYLSNMFSLKLKSDDPTLWRRQIKEAVPLFKKKGTMGGLVSAFGQAGMRLNKFTRLWQVVSPYTWQESFRFHHGDSGTFQLEKIALTPDADNFGLWLRRAGTTTYQSYQSNTVTFQASTCSFGSEMIWNGPALNDGDIVRVMYKYRDVPDDNAQAVEDYIQSLSLADTRDEADQECPKKNWNVRMLEEDDPMFNVLVPVRHPFADQIIFGNVRTEFPYSENIYNMEEYNGSTRESPDPCDIDCDFVDPCGACISSKYNIDIGVEELSDTRIAEIRDILRESTPFHAVPHQITFQGEVTEFIQSPVEDIDCLLTYRVSDFCISGEANTLFARITKNDDGITYNLNVKRTDLADKNAVYSGSGTAYNETVDLVAFISKLDSLQYIPTSHEIEVFSPSPSSGTYTIGRAVGNRAPLTTNVTEPINQSTFTFRMTNVNYRTSIAQIEQDDLYLFSDDKWEVLLTGVDSTWTVNIAGTTYPILDTLPDGSLVIDGEPSVGSGYTYHLYGPDANEVFITDDNTASTTGRVRLVSRGKVTLTGVGVPAVKVVKSGDYLFYNGVEYPVSGSSTSDETLHISGYTLGGVGGAYVECRKRLVDNEVGCFGYAGMKLNTPVNHETGLGILNGYNPPTLDPNLITDNGLFKENFLVQIGSDFYRIEEIDGTVITLGGPQQDWKTLNAGGTSVSYQIVHFPKKMVDVGFNVFYDLGRGGKDPVVTEIYDDVAQVVSVVALQAPEGTDVQDHVRQEEAVSYSIEYKDGTSEKGDLECS